MSDVTGKYQILRKPLGRDVRPTIDRHQISGEEWVMQLGQSTYVWNSMARWPQNDRTKEQTTKERHTQCLQNGGDRYLPTPFLLYSGIGTYRTIYGTRTTTTKNDRTIERQTDANDRTTERQNDRTAKWREAGLYLPTTFMVHGRRRRRTIER